jgi:probable HAF family extracellular repeat protein
MSYPAPAADVYSVTDLGSLSSAGLEFLSSGFLVCGNGAIGLNNRGQVVGNYAEAGLASNGEIGTRGFLWSNGQMVDIGSPNPHFSFQELWTAGINDKGHIAANLSFRCTASIPIPGPPVFFSSPGVFVDLSVKLPQQNWVGAEASGINDRDQIVGTFIGFFRQQMPSLAFIYDVTRNRLTNLPPPQGYVGSSAAAINIQGHVAGGVGTRSSISGDTAAWWNGKWHVLPRLLGNNFCTATGINVFNEVIGSSGSRAFIWNGQMNTLPSLAGTVEDIPLAINDAGIIIGRACDEQAKNCWAVLWDLHHNVANLETLIDRHDPAHG